MVDAPPSPELELPSARGAVRCAYHPCPGAAAAVLMVGGADGGLDGPADALYPELAQDLGALGLAALRVDFRIHRFPGDVEQGVHDVQVGLEFLAAEGVARAGLVGHSFGGAVVIEAAVDSPRVASVATLATQTAGAQRVGALAPRPLLLVHGLNDDRLLPDCSRLLYRQAGEPKRLELLAGARHSLRQRREDVRRLLLDWFTETLAPPSLAGRWRITVRTPMGEQHGTLELAGAPATLRGTVSALGTTAAVSGSFEGGALWLRGTVQAPWRGRQPFTLDGALDGTRLSGTVTLGALGSGLWTAERDEGA
ncbi:MAG: hypothetical protein EXR65_03155 [Dehalococcoidia bacterium]|nr:hypothetical protein [Dehalococcoidia bacterium]